MKSQIKVGMVDDHILVRDALANVIRNYENYTVTLVAENGKDMIHKLNTANCPDILLLDIGMPEMDGHQTLIWLSQNKPDIKVLLVTAYDAESLLHLIKDGARGFVKKDCLFTDLKTALDRVAEGGIFYSQMVTSRLFKLLKNDKTNTSIWGTLVLTKNEIAFLRMATSDMTYKEIALQMEVSPRTVDNYRDNLFQKLNVTSRVGLALYAVKSGIATINY